MEPLAIAFLFIIGVSSVGVVILIGFSAYELYTMFTGKHNHNRR